MTGPNFRDGSPVLRDGAAMVQEEPLADSAPGSAEEAEATPQVEKGIAWRGNEKERIGSVRVRAPAAGSPVGSYVAVFLREADLSAASEALSGWSVKAWLTVPTPQGPVPVELGEYLYGRIPPEERPGES